jgi:hypothetical protein
MTIHTLLMHLTPTRQKQVDLGTMMILVPLLVILRLTLLAEFRLADQVWMRMGHFLILHQVDLEVVRRAPGKLQLQHLQARVQRLLSVEQCSMQIRMLLFGQRLGPRRRVGPVARLAMRTIRGIDRIQGKGTEEWAGILLGYDLAFAS